MESVAMHEKARRPGKVQALSRSLCVNALNAASTPPQKDTADVVRSEGVLASEGGW